MRSWLGLLLLVAGALTGCRGEAETQPPLAQAAEYGDLPGVRRTTHLELRDELARIEEEKGTPKLLMQNDLPPQENLAVGLEGVIPKAKLLPYLGQSADLFPSEGFVFTPLGLEKAIRFKNRNESVRRQVEEALKRPRSNFGIQFTAGYGADLHFVDVVQVCARLEAFEAAERMSKSELDGAVQAVQRMLRLAACLAAEKHVTVRLQGAYTRTEALTVLQALVRQPGLQRSHVEQLAVTMAEELADWPRDADAWIGDRAVGLHAYELVRAGKTPMLLTQEEVAHLPDHSTLADLALVAKQSVDVDEHYYLRAMRRLIEACRQPYYLRLPRFAELAHDLQQRENTPSYPLVAGRLLLSQIQQGQAVQAQDRANCEAWALALTQAIGQPSPPYRVNPLTGAAYQVVAERGEIVVGNLNTDPRNSRPVTVVVPDLRPAPAPEAAAAADR